MHFILRYMASKLQCTFGSRGLLWVLCVCEGSGVCALSVLWFSDVSGVYEWHFVPEERKSKSVCFGIASFSVCCRIGDVDAGYLY